MLGKGPLKAAGDNVDYASKKQKVQDGIVKNLKFLGMDGQVLTAGRSGKIPPGQLNGGSTSTSESFQYYYHPDHLGSTSYMTDASGEVYQHLEYFAFGETFVEEHSNTDRTPYLYNGKELDEETGLYYYEARYYDAKISVWLGVDPKMDKYPGLTPYNYVFNNPLVIVDFDGRDGTIVIQVMVDQQGRPVVTIRETYKGMNVDLKVEVKYSNQVMTNEEFYSRKGAHESDSYVIIGTENQLKEVDMNAESNGWEKMGVNMGERNGRSARDQNYALINADNVNVIERLFENFATTAQKIATVVMHETGHPKFKDHPRDGNNPNVPGHVEGTIMDERPGGNDKHDFWMQDKLQKIHGAINPRPRSDHSRSANEGCID
jgi:RHS repeat-associated protein